MSAENSVHFPSKINERLAAQCAPQPGGCPSYSEPEGRDPRIRMSTRRSGAFFPVFARSKERDADNSQNMIHGVDIRANIARLDGPFIDHRSRSPNFRHAFFKHGVAAHQTVQCGRNNLLGGKVLDKEVQPGPYGFFRRQLARELLGSLREFLHLGPVNSPQKRLTGRKVPVKRARADASLLGDVIEARTGAVLRESLFRDL